MRRYRLSRLARSDIVDILAWSAEHFGDDARDRYQRLLVTAMNEIATDPAGAGSKLRPEIGPGIRSWHLRSSRDRAGKPSVHSPRHFVIYRVDGDLVVIGRVLHDAMDVPAHLEDYSFDQ